MINYENSSEFGTSGYGLYEVLSVVDNLDEHDVELIINSNSGVTQTIFLNAIKTIQIYDNFAIFVGLNGIRDFLNLNNVLSMSLMGDV